MLFLNKKNSTTVEDIAEAFIYIDKSIKNLNRNVKSSWYTYTISDFHHSVVQTRLSFLRVV